MLLLAVVAGAASADDFDALRSDAPPATVKSSAERSRIRSAFAQWDDVESASEAERVKPAGDFTLPALPTTEPAPTVPSRERDEFLLPIPDDLDARRTAEEQDNGRRSGYRQLPVSLQPEAEPIEARYQETPIDEILPYYDYVPIRIQEREKDCLVVCPCPAGTDCRKPGGMRTCRCPEDDITPPWKEVAYEPRAFEQELFTWDASNVYSNPLYFEDFALERYGHSYPAPIQPFVSIGRFAGQLALLPYQAKIDPCRKRMYPLGYYRPGEWAPKLHYQLPLNVDAALVEAGVVTGMFYIFP